MRLIGVLGFRYHEREVDIHELVVGALLGCLQVLLLDAEVKERTD